jgi:hypothetical protein
VNKFLRRLCLAFIPGVCGKHELKHTYPIGLGFLACPQCVWERALERYDDAVLRGVVPADGVEFRFRTMQKSIERYKERV